MPGCSIVDPELDEALADVTAEHRFVLGDDDDLYAAPDAEPRRRGSPTRTPPRRSTTPRGTTARPKGVQITHRNIWTNAVTFALHVAVTDRDVYLHTLPMFHANGWGMPFAMTGVGARHVVLRKVDGAEILRRVERPRRHRDVRGARPWRPPCSRPRRPGRARSRGATRCASSWPAPRRRRRPSRGSRRSSAGSSSRSTASPRPRRCSPSTGTRAEWDDLSRRGARRSS